MKRVSLMLISLLMVCFFTACSGGENREKKAEAETATTTESAAQPTEHGQSQHTSDQAQPAAAAPAGTAPAQQ